MLRGILAGLGLGAIVSGGLALTVSTMVPVGTPVATNTVNTSKPETNSNVASLESSETPAPQEKSVDVNIASAPATVTDTAEKTVDVSPKPVVIATVTKDAPVKEVLTDTSNNVALTGAKKHVQPRQASVIKTAMAGEIERPHSMQLDATVVLAGIDPVFSITPAALISRPSAIEKPVMPSNHIAVSQPSIGWAGVLDTKSQGVSEVSAVVKADSPVVTTEASMILSQPSDESAPVIRTDSIAARRTQATTTMTPQTNSASTPKIGLGQSAGSFIDRKKKKSGGVRINRPGSKPEETEDDKVEAEELAEKANEIPPLRRYARSFKNPEEKPLFGIVLIDQGQKFDGDGTGLKALTSLKIPLAVAVDPSLKDAKERMRNYRYKGIEVLALIDLPLRARATDAEVTMGVALERMPEVVGVMDGLETGVQVSSEAMKQVVAYLGKSGHGLVARGKSLNGIERHSLKEGVPTQTVFREFGGSDQSVSSIQRTLDQAAFQARRDGYVVLQGTISSKTLEALKTWRENDGAEKIIFAPISSVLSVSDY